MTTDGEYVGVPYIVLSNMEQTLVSDGLGWELAENTGRINGQCEKVGLFFACLLFFMRKVANWGGRGGWHTQLFLLIT